MTLSSSSHLPDAEALYAELARGVQQLLAASPAPVVLAGITSGGAWLAERLQRDLGLPGAAGVISSSMHRDDFAQRGLASSAQTVLPFDVNGAHVLLIDDVLYTGRTLRAVINELFDYGRPGQRAAGGAGGPRRARAADRARCVRRAPGCAGRPIARTRARRRRPPELRAGNQGRLTVQRKNPQLNKNGELIHLLSTEGLSRDILTQILDTAANFVSVSNREVKKVPLLRGKSVFNLFFENSTRTRTTFEIAATRLSADVINLDIARSSTAKGESLLDTIANLSAMAADIFVVRHSESGAPYLIAQHVAPHVHVVNAGDGRHAHPTQGLLDMYTIRHYKKDFTKLSVAIVGDVLHSRVARSDIHALTTLGCPDVRVVGPRTLVPSDLSQMGVRVCHTLEEGIKDCDVVITLRLQNERMSGRAAAVEPGVLQELRPHARAPALGQGRCDRDAPGPDQPRRGDRLVRGGRTAERDPAASHLRHCGAHGSHGDRRRERGINT